MANGVKLKNLKIESEFESLEMRVGGFGVPYRFRAMLQLLKLLIKFQKDDII